MSDAPAADVMENTVAPTIPLDDVMSSESSAKRKASADASDPHSASARGGGAGGGRGRGSKRGRGGRGGGGSGGTGDRGDDATCDAAAAAASSSSSAVPAVPLTPIQHQFTAYAAYLDARNDRRERVVQSSRDLTRQSKKLISQLQRVTHAAPGERESVLAAARTTHLPDLHRLLDATVADFQPEEYWRYAGAFSPGAQEFIEAASFLHYLEHATLVTHAQLEADIAATLGHTRLSIPLSDYLLGITDLGGELMRYATNSVTRGAEGRRVIGEVADFLRAVQGEFQRIQGSMPTQGAFKELPKKLDVWMQSLMKIETLAYKLHIRGAEFPDARVLDLMPLNSWTSGAGDRGGAGEPRDESHAAGDREE